MGRGDGEGCNEIQAIWEVERICRRDETITRIPRRLQEGKRSASVIQKIVDSEQGLPPIEVVFSN